MDILQTILHRRSIRRFDTRQIEEETLQKILQAGLYAPSAGGRQGVIFAVNQNREVNERLGKIKRANSYFRMSTATRYVSREQPSIVDDGKADQRFLRCAHGHHPVRPERFSLCGRGLRRGRRKHDAGGGCAGRGQLLYRPGLDRLCCPLRAGYPAAMGHPHRLLRRDAAASWLPPPR